MDAFCDVHSRLLWPEKTVNQIPQAVRLLDDDVGILRQRRVGQRLGQKLRRAA